MKGYQFVKVPGGTNLLGLHQGMSLLENRHGSEFTVTYNHQCGVLAHEVE
jgi:hypothetical protein